MGNFTLILGGSNSGKSKFAESLAQKHTTVMYLATAEALDKEMEAKLKKHRESRPQEWKTIEEPVHIDRVIEKEGNNFSAILMECILLWINNVILKNPDRNDDEIEKLILDRMDRSIEIMGKSKADFFVVSGEIGLGLIGENRSVRLYGRILGEVNQLLAQKADEVYFVVAGIPSKIK